jgi:hypothetical protein
MSLTCTRNVFFMENHYCLKYYTYILHTLSHFHVQKFIFNFERRLMLFVLYICLEDTQM